MESEADLDEEIKNLLALTQAPQHYRELVSLGSIASLLSLLSHENTDIALDAIELINELTDEDIISGEEIDDEEKAEAITESINIFVKALVSRWYFGGETMFYSNDNLPPIVIQIDEQLPELLVQNLQRLDENEAADRQGVFNALSKWTMKKEKKNKNKRVKGGCRLIQVYSRYIRKSGLHRHKVRRYNRGKDRLVTMVTQAHQHESI